MEHYLMSFIRVFIVFLLGYYLVPVGLAYFVFFVWKRKQWSHKRIQSKYPDIKSIKREISWSLLALSIFAFLTVFMLDFIEAGYTKMYFDLQQYGIFYLLISPLIAIVLHDTYYYWMHRAMHHKLLFRFTHKVHHQSITPTPWAIYAFQPLEAIFTYFSFAFAIFVIPMHPYALGFYLVISLINNVGGHTGYEILPAWAVKNKVFRLSNVVTFHDQHHTEFNCNYGAYFNIWDRIMKTVHKDFEKKFYEVKSQKTKE